MSFITPVNLDDLPTAIWMPSGSSSVLPECYQGTPLEIVQAIAKDLHPGVTDNEAIDWLIQFLEENRQLRIRIPEVSAEVRARLFLMVLLKFRVAEPMAHA